MDSALEAEAQEHGPVGALSCVGAALAYLGFAAVVVSAAWTTRPLADPGKYQGPSLLVLGVVLVAATLIGRQALAGGALGKLLCGAGAVVCLSVAVDPTLESVGSVSERLPGWVLDAYPGLATVGWIVAAAGALLWWIGGGRARQGSLYRWVALVCSCALVLVALGVRQALVAARYDVPGYPTGLLVWRLLETGVTLVVALSVCGARSFRQWPMLLFGLGLAAHGVRGFIGPSPE